MRMSAISSGNAKRITLRQERDWLIRNWADTDAEGIHENLLRMAATEARLPEPIIVPAHDSRGFAEKPNPSQTKSISDKTPDYSTGVKRI